MENKLDILTQKLYNEGVDKARQEAENIINQAKQEAEKIIADAKAKVAQMNADAETEISNLKKKAESEMIKCAPSYHGFKTGNHESGCRECSRGCSQDRVRRKSFYSGVAYDDREEVGCCRWKPEHGNSSFRG